MSGDVERAAAWTRLTGGANALVWNLPLPRRALTFLSQFVYRNPPIPQARVIETIGALEAAEVKTVLVGGWGIDALAGRQQRPHRDLDLIADVSQLDRALEVLVGLGYEPWHRDPSPQPLGELEICAAEAFHDRAMRVVELHGADLDQADLTIGSVGGRSVLCISAEQQRKAQVGRNWTHDRRTRRRRNLESLEALEQTSDRSDY